MPKLTTKFVMDEKILRWALEEAAWRARRGDDLAVENLVDELLRYRKAKMNFAEMRQQGRYGYCITNLTAAEKKNLRQRLRDKLQASEK